MTLYLSEIIKKELTRKVHKFVQEAPIKMPPCIADKAQSTEDRHKYASVVVFHRIPPSPAKTHKHIPTVYLSTSVA